MGVGNGVGPCTHTVVCVLHSRECWAWISSSKAQRWWPQATTRGIQALNLLTSDASLRMLSRTSLDLSSKIRELCIL